MAEPTVIDTLVVALGLDPAKYVSGRKEVEAEHAKVRQQAVKTAGEMESRGAQAAQFFGKIKGEALGLFAVITGAGGLERFTANTVTNFASMGRAAQSMGVNVSQLAAFQNMIVRNGGSADAAKQSLQGLAQAMEQWKMTGNTAMLPWLNRVGASANDDALGVYDKFAKWSQGKDAKAVNLVGQGLGLDASSINQAMKGQQAFHAGMAKSYDLGVPSDADVKKVTALQGAFLELRQAISGDAQALVSEFSPAMTDAFNSVSALIEANKTLAKVAIAGGAAAAALGSAWGAAKVAGGLAGLLNGKTASGGAAAAAEGEAASLAASGGGKVAAGAAERAAVRAAAAKAAARMALFRGGAKFLGPAGILYDIFRPDEANKGEAEALAHARAAMGMAGVKGGTNRDVDLAVRTLIGEARVGDTRGQMDVAHVIKNRMRASGKGAGDVVMQKGQFEPWMTEASRKRLMAIDPNSKAYRTALHSWVAAMAEEDPTGGATLFVSPGGQRAAGRGMPAWADPAKRTLERGGHQFYSGGFPGGRRGGSMIGQAANVTVTNSTTVGSVVITTNATDAKGVAKEFRGALDRLNTANQANSGLS